MYFQELILTLQNFWTARGCLLVQPYNSEVGAGTFNPSTFLRSLGPEPWAVAFVEPSRRPADGRYGDNPNRLQQFHQFQVILKPSPSDIQDQYLASLHALGTPPDWQPVSGMVEFIDDQLGINSGSQPLTSGRGGFGCSVKDVTRRCFFDQLELYRQV